MTQAALSAMADVLAAARFNRADVKEAFEELSEEVGYLEGELTELRSAAHMLHEQAHGSIPWLTCPFDPCSNIYGEQDRGPAPLTMVGGGYV